MIIRLQKHIANLGICSRRKAEVLIAEGKVKVNGKIIKELGTKVDPQNDNVKVLNNGQRSEVRGQMSEVKCQRSGVRGQVLVYISLNKPVDYISSASNEQGQTVLDLLTKENNIGKDKQDLNTRVYPVGRLDKDSEGLILLTNDGELTNLLTHPRYEHEKEYEVVINHPLSRDSKSVLEKGMNIEGEQYHGIIIKKEFNKGRQTIVTVILKEGKNRQIRKMFGRLGYNVSTLRRVRIAKLKLGTLPVGKWRLDKRENIV
ncbi:MAG: pseudouridine synthase [bacterium]|nr:pseudouridine synthase [bacterium]